MKDREIYIEAFHIVKLSDEIAKVPVFLVLNRPSFIYSDNETGDWESWAKWQGYQRYMIEESQCTVNLMRPVIEETQVDGEADYHGIFDHIVSVAGHNEFNDMVKAMRYDSKGMYRFCRILPLEMRKVWFHSHYWDPEAIHPFWELVKRQKYNWGQVCKDAAAGKYGSESEQKITNGFSNAVVHY